ncbi:MAG: RHS repeat-associated core domain-containing protein [Thermoanaerobaculia bacterium]
MTRAQSGSITSTLTYDSLSRPTSETTDGKTTLYRRDDVGNPSETDYPSGLAVTRQFDALDRVRTIAAPGSAAGVASFDYQGVGRVVGSDLGASLHASSLLDEIGRPRYRQVATPLAQVFAESTSFSPRSLASATTRWDVAARGEIHRYDGAGRLEQTEIALHPTASIPNNHAAPPLDFSEVKDGFGFGYTAAEHLTHQIRKQDGVEAAVNSLPADASGRNRPASANGKALTWDANGNLVRKGDTEYAYDYRNRLVRVRRDGVGEIASYDYDAFNRRTYRRVGSADHRTVWSGWQSIEEYGEAGLAARRVYGLGLDEIVRSEVDLDGDGAVETVHRPIYDRMGNVALLASEAGKPIERYEYQPYGPAKIEADLVPPQVVQVLRSEEGSVQISFSEGISAEELRRRLQSPDPGSAMTLHVDGVPYGIEFHGAAPQTNDLAMVPGAAKVESRSSVAHATQQAGGPAVVPQDGGPIATLELVTIPGLESGRILRLAPTPPIPDGATVEIVFQPEAVQDPFQNHPVAPIAESFTWPATSGAIRDSTPPAVEKVIARPDELAILFSEEVSPESVVAAVKLDGQSLPWQSCGNAFTYCAPATVVPGPHQVTVGTAIEDLSGKPLSVQLTAPFRLDNATGAIAYEKLDEREIAESAALNPFGFQGLPRDPETGFLYVRNRYYDPEMGRFTTADPLGFVDGPSEYAFAGNEPATGGDPLGLYGEAGHYYTVLWVALQIGYSFEEAERIAFFAQVPDEMGELDATENWFDAQSERTWNKLRIHNENAATRRMIENQTALHALTGGSSDLETRLAVEAARLAPDQASFGFQLHRLGDSFSHRELGNEAKLYDPGFGHGEELNEGTSPDTIQRRPDLYLTYVRTLATVLAARSGTSLSTSKLRRISASVLSFAAAAPTEDHWYKWRNADNVPLERAAVAALRGLILDFGVAQGAQLDAQRVLDYRPELMSTSKRSGTHVLNQFLGARGRLGATQEQGIEMIDRALEYALAGYRSAH